MQRPKCRKQLDLEGMEQQAANVVLGAPGQGDRRWCRSGEEGWHKQGLSAKTRASFLSLYSTFFLLVPAKHKAFCFGQCPAPRPHPETRCTFIRAPSAEQNPQSTTRSAAWGQCLTCAWVLQMMTHFGASSLPQPPQAEY